MKNKKLVKNIISLLLFIIMLYLFITLGQKDYSNNIVDNIKFANEYKDISKDNVFVYTKEPAILDILNGKSGIIFMGFSGNIWSHYYADYLNEIVKKHEIEKIYYYDFHLSRNLNTNSYLKIVEKLADYLYSNDSGMMDLNAPTIIIVKEGKIIYYDDEVCRIKGHITPQEYFTDYKRNLFMANIENALSEYHKGD